MSDVVLVAIITTLVPTATFFLKVGRDVLAYFKRRSEARVQIVAEAMVAKNEEIDALRAKYETCRDDLHAAWKRIGQPEIGR